MDIFAYGLVVPAVVAIALFGLFYFTTIRVVGQYESGVLLTFGKFSRVVNPGLNLLVPGAHTIITADIRVTAIDIPPQDVITSDNVSVKVSAVAYYQIEDAHKALLDVQDYKAAIAQLAQITLRSTIGQHKLDELLSQQDTLNKTLSEAIESRSKKWGIRVDHVEIRSVDLADSMIRAMAQEAEAERGRRARLITATGEFEAAQKLAEAADILARNPAALQLRTLATLKEIGAEQNSVIIFPVSQESMMGPQLAASLAQTAAERAAGAVASRT